MLTTVLELVGLSLLVTCAAVIWWPAAFGVAGLGLILLSRGMSK